jgi:4-carboxymuconolactone decarboxylase
MSNTTHVRRRTAAAMAAATALGLAASVGHASQNQESTRMTNTSNSDTLSAAQQAIVPIAAFAAAGDIAKLNAALNQGLDAGLTVSDAREVLVQLYAYAGFPRSLNALGN